jgi:hypothetical protein
MQLYDPFAYQIARIAIEKRLEAQAEGAIGDEIRPILARMRELLGRCFGCAACLQAHEVIEGRTLCLACRGKRVWVRN